MPRAPPNARAPCARAGAVGRRRVRAACRARRRTPERRARGPGPEAGGAFARHAARAAERPSAMREGRGRRRRLWRSHPLRASLVTCHRSAMHRARMRIGWALAHRGLAARPGHCTRGGDDGDDDDGGPMGTAARLALMVGQGPPYAPAPAPAPAPDPESRIPNPGFTHESRRSPRPARGGRCRLQGSGAGLRQAAGVSAWPAVRAVRWRRADRP